MCEVGCCVCEVGCCVCEVGCCVCEVSLLHRPLKEGLLSTACACAKLLDFFP